MDNNSKAADVDFDESTLAEVTQSPEEHAKIRAVWNFIRSPKMNELFKADSMYLKETKKNENTAKDNDDLAEMPAPEGMEIKSDKFPITPKALDDLRLIKSCTNLFRNFTADRDGIYKDRNEVEDPFAKAVYDKAVEVFSGDPDRCGKLFNNLLTRQEQLLLQSTVGHPEGYQTSIGDPFVDDGKLKVTFFLKPSQQQQAVANDSSISVSNIMSSIKNIFSRKEEKQSPIQELTEEEILRKISDFERENGKAQGFEEPVRVKKNESTKEAKEAQEAKDFVNQIEQKASAKYDADLKIKTEIDAIWKQTLQSVNEIYQEDVSAKLVELIEKTDVTPKTQQPPDSKAIEDSQKNIQAPRANNEEKNTALSPEQIWKQIEQRVDSVYPGQNVFQKAMEAADKEEERMAIKAEPGNPQQRDSSSQSVTSMPDAEPNRTDRSTSYNAKVTNVNRANGVITIKNLESNKIKKFSLSDISNFHIGDTVKVTPNTHGPTKIESMKNKVEISRENTKTNRR